VKSTDSEWSLKLQNRQVMSVTIRDVLRLAHPALLNRSRSSPHFIGQHGRATQLIDGVKSGRRTRCVSKSCWHTYLFCHADKLIYELWLPKTFYYCTHDTKLSWYFIQLILFFDAINEIVDVVLHDLRLQVNQRPYMLHTFVITT